MNYSLLRVWQNSAEWTDFRKKNYKNAAVPQIACHLETIESYQKINTSLVLHEPK